MQADSQQKAVPFSDFLYLIEKEAGRYFVELIPVGEESGIAPQALLILNRNLPEKRKNEIKGAIVATNIATTKKDQFPAHTQNGASRQCTEADNFIGRLRAALALVTKNRLPCSLLLIRFSEVEGNNLSKNAVATLTSELEYSCHLTCIDNSTLALLLPGQNRNRALRKARAIHKFLSANNAGRILIGLAVCVAGEVPEAGEFMETALGEIRKGEHEPGDIFYTLKDRDDDSCQVTAEERAHLLCFFNRGETV